MIKDTSHSTPQDAPSKSRSPSSERANGPPRKRPRTHASLPPSSMRTDDPATMTTTTTTTAHISSSNLQAQTHRFSIQPLNRFKGASTSIKRPREVAHFSFDDNHEYVADDSGISYYVPPPMGVDLKEGFDTFRRHEDKVDAHLDALLKGLIDQEKKNGEVAQVKADFVTWRGMMTKVC
jgi:RAT1-interacting protein